MSSTFRKDLKIEFRAVPYGSLSHVLEYRISPDQDLTYEEYDSWLWGLIKFKRKRKFSTEWYTAHHFLNYPSACLHEKEDNYHPIFIDTIKELNEYKQKYKTIGDFYEMIDKWNEKEISEWSIKRMNYLENHNIWE